MNNLLPPDIRHTTHVATSNNSKANPVETFRDVKEKQTIQQRPFVERRRKGDRRSGRDASRAIYDMRASKGRRRSDRGGIKQVQTEA